MKKIILLAGVICVALALLIYILSTHSTQLPKDSDKLHIVSSFYPLEFFTQQIAGNRAIVTNIAGNANVHTYTPTPQDLAQMMHADLVVYHSGELESWVNDLIPQLQEKQIPTLSVVQDIELHNTQNNHTDTTKHHHTFDPHIWLDPILAQQIAQNITNKLIDIDPQHANIYTNNLTQLTQKLAQLHQDYTTGLTHCERHEVLVSHNAFGYIGRRYNITFYPIAGLSTNDTPSAKILADLRQRAHAGITHILTEENDVKRFAQTLATETGLQMLPINSLGRGVSDANKDYFDIMYSNLANLQTALACQ